MKWSFEQKLAWAKSYMAGELVPVPTGFPGTLKGWHDRVNRWVNVLLKYGEEGLNPSPRNRSFPPESKLMAVKRVPSKFIRAENNAPITYASEIENKVSITVHQGDRTTIILADPKEPLAVAIERSGNFIHTSCRHGHCGLCRIEVLSGDYAIPKRKDQRRYGDKALNVVHGCCTFPLSDLEIRIPIPAVDFLTRKHLIRFEIP